MLSIITRSPEETRKVGQTMGRNLFPSSVVALMGELGSGKTVLAQGIAQGLGITSLVKSPSFVIVREYEGFLPLYHLDLYRIRTEEEIISLGYEEYLYQKKGVVVIEWAERMKNLLKLSHLQVRLEVMSPLERRLIFHPHGTLYDKIVQRIKREKIKEWGV